MHPASITATKLLKEVLLNRLKTFSKTAFSNKYLLYTNVGISISLSAVGDVIEQHYEILKGELKKYDQLRTHHMSISGMTVGIICHNWYKYLDKRLPGRTIGIVMKKVVIDQIVCSPICISMFFITLAILEKTSKDELIEEIKKKAWRLYAAEWVVWPPAQIINFYILPHRFRVLYDNSISLGYDIYTSHVKHDPADNDRNHEKEQRI